MKWTEVPGPYLRNKEYGDLDLTRMRLWNAMYKGNSYVINWDPKFPQLGYNASYKSKSEMSAVFIGRSLKTFNEAEQICISHSKGRQ